MFGELPRDDRVELEVQVQVQVIPPTLCQYLLVTLPRCASLCLTRQYLTYAARRKGDTRSRSGEKGRLEM